MFKILFLQLNAIVFKNIAKLNSKPLLKVEKKCCHICQPVLHNFCVHQLHHEAKKKTEPVSKIQHFSASWVVS